MFIILFNCSLGATSNIVVFYFDCGKKYSAALPSTIYNLLILFAVFFLSDLSYAYDSILEKLEELENTNSRRINYAIFNKIISLSSDLHFTAFNTYKINTKLFMSMLSMIISLSTILIQTSDIE